MRRLINETILMIYILLFDMVGHGRIRKMGSNRVSGRLLCVSRNPRHGKRQILDLLIRQPAYKAGGKVKTFSVLKSKQRC